MWICFNDGFISAVQSKDDPEVLVIRSRRLRDLENVVGTNRNIEVNAGTDYKYRTEISKTDWSDIVTKRIMNTDYTNFKSSVKNGPLHKLYVKMWNLHYMYQSHFS
jgi:hypothetical protein